MAAYKMDMNVKKGIVYAQNFIDGEFEDAAAGYVDSHNPATGEVWARVPNSGGYDVDRAAKAAKTAFPGWAALSYDKRAEFIMKVAALLEQRIDEFALAESRDQGKPVALAKNMDITRAIMNLRAFAEAWKSHVGASHEMPESSCISFSTRGPVGVAGIIAPWNLPLYLLTFKLGPALVAGNTVVCKPSETTTVTAWMLMKLFHQAGFPTGVVNLVCGLGAGAGEAIVKHRDIRVISFTGSTAVGERIATIAAPMMKKLSLELGGKNAAIVFDDADLDKAVATLKRSCFLNQGEICLCTSRLFVQEGIYDDLVARLVEEAKAIKVGDPEEEDVFMGALNSKQHLEKVRSYMGYAVEDGGQILCGETPNATPLELPARLKNGYFFRPTIIAGLSDDSRCMQIKDEAVDRIALAG